MNDQTMNVCISTEKSQDFYHEVNEDRYMFSRYQFNEDLEVSLLLIADGMGGLAHGERASANAITGFLNTFYSSLVQKYMEANSEIDGYSLEYDYESVRESMIQAILAANREVCQKAEPGEETGSTISAVCLVGHLAVFANIGDSPVYYYRKKRRRMKLVSKLQTKAEQDVEAGVYERFSPEYWANEHRIYCSLGQYSELNPDDIYIQSIGQIEKGDVILMGSDGAFGRISDREIEELVDQCPDDEKGFLLDQLFELARMDKDDDQTAILYTVSGRE